jgi:hypothetical protein
MLCIYFRTVCRDANTYSIAKIVTVKPELTERGFEESPWRLQLLAGHGEQSVTILDTKNKDNCKHDHTNDGNSTIVTSTEPYTIETDQTSYLC